jgi:thymidylate synthase (FAD)
MDAMDLVPNKKIQCLDHGFVELVDVMPRIVPDGQTCDYAICQMARTSYGSGTKTINEDKGLLNLLMRNSHTSPFEAIEIKLHMKMPIFCARQLIRHRSSSLNEISARYSVMKDEFYLPKADELRKQSTSNKQGSEGSLDDIQASVFSQNIESICKGAYDLYERMIEAGVAREQARMVLPVNLYTEWYWKQDLHNLMHLMALRCDHHAQYEVQVYGNAILEIVKHICPWTIEAWEKYHPLRGAVKLTALEADAIRQHNIQRDQNQGIAWMGHVYSDNKREKKEWVEKATDLGFNILDR